MTAYLQFKDRLKENGQTLTDFAKSIPFAVSDLELTKQNNDLVISGPFAEPDGGGFFLRRQRKAFPGSSEHRSHPRYGPLGGSVPI